MIITQKMNEWLQRIKWVMLCSQCDMDPETFQLKSNECTCQSADIHVKRTKYLYSVRCKQCGKLINES